MKHDMCVTVIIQLSTRFWILVGLCINFLMVARYHHQLVDKYFLGAMKYNGNGVRRLFGIFSSGLADIAEAMCAVQNL